MNGMQKVYCDGAAMAYRDCASQVRHMIANSPRELKPFIDSLQPLALAYEAKANGIHKAAEGLDYDR